MKRSKSKAMFILFTGLGLFIFLSIATKVILVTGNGNLDLVRYMTTALSGFTALTAGYMAFHYNQKNENEFIGLKIFNILLISLVSFGIAFFGLYYFFI